MQLSCQVPDCIELPVWNLEVEDWNEGERVDVVEDRGLGYVTREVYYETSKTKIAVGETELKPWKDIPQVGPQVSGVGYYTIGCAAPGGVEGERSLFGNRLHQRQHGGGLRERAEGPCCRF